jgi:hypothetical protein
MLGKRIQGGGPAAFSERATTPLLAPKVADSMARCELAQNLDFGSLFRPS